MYDKQALIALVREKALEFGDFTLASGKKASYYLDCRKITLDSRGANLIAEGILELLGDDLPDAVGGMAIGADPITAARDHGRGPARQAATRLHRSQGSQDARQGPRRRRAGFAIEQILEDIESLNRRALAGELEVTGLSIHAYAHLADRYALMPCGASMGDGYGPMLVAKEPFAADPVSLARLKFAVPGTLTSAFLALELYLGGRPEHVVVPFDAILDHVQAGGADVGLVIHEGQLTYSRMGLHRIVDLGSWWKDRTDGLPFPLGGNGVRKDLGRKTMAALTRVLKRSIAYGLENRKDALAYARDLGRGLDDTLTDRFVSI